MSDEDKNFGGSLVLDFRKGWHHVKTIYLASTSAFTWTGANPTAATSVLFKGNIKSCGNSAQKRSVTASSYRTSLCPKVQPNIDIHSKPSIAKTPLGQFVSSPPIVHLLHMFHENSSPANLIWE